MLDVCLPGTGGMMPLENRWLTCCWMEYQGTALLIDCGEGTQIALKKAGCKLGRLRLLLLTHYHADHVAGLPGLLLSIGNCGKTDLLTIAGPKGLRQLISAAAVIAPVLPYPVELVELEPGERVDGWEGLSVTCGEMSHWIACLGYRVSIARKPVFSPEKAQALEIPPRLYHALHEGNPVVLADGREIRPEQVIDRPRPPLVVSYCTDTLPVDQIAELARDADLMIAEGMYGDDAMGGKVQEKGHMLFSDAARLARRAGARKLWLTHYSPALTDPEACIWAARSVFPESTAAYDGIRMTLGAKHREKAV